MLAFFFVVCCFFFLTVGAVVLLICATVSPLRRFALSAGLWCAVWGPCVCAWVLFGSMAGFVADYGLPKLADGQIRPEDWVKGFGIGIAGLAIVFTALFATVVAYAHQWIIRRFTFSLFRIYATFVSAGVGSVFAWSLLFLMGSLGVGIKPWIVVPVMSLALIGLFGFVGYRWAKRLRGTPPERFSWVTPEEFEGG